MACLYIDRKDTQLHWRGGALELRVPGERLRSVPGRLIERIVLRADTLIGSATLAALAEAGIGIVALGGRGGQHVAHVLGAPHGDAHTRVAQCRLLGDPLFEAAWSARLVRAKLAAQARVIASARRERPDLRKPLGDALDALGRLTDRMRAMPAAELGVDSVRGMEGAGAAAYFGGFVTLFAPSLGFAGRRRRPPPDPVNATLSLGYTLLQADAVHACWLAGLDPMVGFLHRPAHGRPSMACDLVEPWRAQVDAWTWRQFRDRALRDDHFGRDGSGACLLGKAGRAHFYAAFADVRRRCAAGMRRHARRCAARLALANDVPTVEDDGDTWSAA